MGDKNFLLAAMLVVILSWGLSPDGNASLGSQAKGSTAHHIFYVSVKGNSTDSGSRKSPWDLQTAFNQPASVQHGDTVIIEGGIYRGHFTSQLTGTQSGPIKVAAMFKNHVLIESNDASSVASLVVNGAWTNYKNLVIKGTDPQTLISGHSGNRFIHVIITDPKTHSGPLNIKGKTMTISTRDGINKTLLEDISSGS